MTFIPYTRKLWASAKDWNKDTFSKTSALLSTEDAVHETIFAKVQHLSGNGYGIIAWMIWKHLLIYFFWFNALFAYTNIS